MRRLLLVLAPVLLAGLLLAGVEPLWLTVPLGVTAVLVAPGHALVDLVAPQHLRSLSGLALVPATSAGTAVVSGVLLDRLPGGLSARGWAVLLAAVTVAATALAVHRDRELPAPTGERASPGTGARTHAGTLLRVGVCVALAAGAVALAQDSQQALDDRQPLTQLWVAAGPGEAQTVHLRNEEGRERSYDVRVRVGQGAQQQLQATVRDGATWTAPVGAGARAREQVSVEVFVDGGAEPYRSVVLRAAAR